MLLRSSANKENLAELAADGNTVQKASEVLDDLLDFRLERKFPLVPELYGPVRFEWTYLFFGSSMKKSTCDHLPELNPKQYYLSSSGEEQLEIVARAEILVKHARENTTNKVSEYTWEADLRTDLFGKMREDPRLRMDKTPYLYKYKDAVTSSICVRKRTPDMTFGLATISNTTAQKRSESIGSSSVEYPDSFVKERLQKQLHHRNCGLVVDPKWGNVDLIFPFATYEAKKKKKSLEDAERQLLEAGSIYLGMLDDLQRDPYRHDQYQSGIKVLPLMFGFTSSGSTVCVYIIHPAAGEFIVEPTWCGNICDLETARQAICLVDSIHNYGVTHHRNAVAKYLKAWLKFADQELDTEHPCENIESNFDQSPQRKRRRPLKPEWKTLLDTSTTHQMRRLNKLKRREFERRQKKKDFFNYWPSEQMDRQIAYKREAMNGFEGQLGWFINSSIQQYKEIIFAEQTGAELEQT